MYDGRGRQQLALPREGCWAHISTEAQRGESNWKPFTLKTHLHPPPMMSLLKRDLTSYTSPEWTTNWGPSVEILKTGEGTFSFRTPLYFISFPRMPVVVLPSNVHWTHAFPIDLPISFLVYFLLSVCIFTWNKCTSVFVSITSQKGTCKRILVITNTDRTLQSDRVVEESGNSVLIMRSHKLSVIVQTL